MKGILVGTSTLLCVAAAVLMSAPSAAPSSAVTQNQAAQKQPPADFVPYDQGPQPLNQVTPKYPELATRAGLEGTVWVKLWIDEAGKVVKADVTKSDVEMFNEPAIEAAMQWTFRPALLKGKPVAVWVSVPFRFKLAGYPLETQTERAPRGSNLGTPELLLIGAIVFLFWLVPVVFAVIALVSILKSQFPGTNDKLVWTIVAILVPIIGPILYFVIGRKQRIQIPS